MIDGGLRKTFHSHLPKFHWQSIELGAVGSGAPDDNACFGGVEFWIEYKKTAANRLAHPFSPEQIAWTERRLRAGGRVFVAVRRQNRPTGADELHLFPGSAARALNQGGIQAARPISAWANGPARWNWAEIAQKLTGR